MRHISPISATDREARVEYPLDRWISTAFTRGSAAARGQPLQVRAVILQLYLPVFTP